MIHEHTLTASAKGRPGRVGRDGSVSCRLPGPADPTTTLRWHCSSELTVQPASERDMAISGRQRPSAGKALRGHPQAGSVDPIAVVHPPVCGAGLEGPPSCHVGSQLVPLDSLATEVDGVPVQSRPVIVGGQAEAKGAQHHWQPTASAIPTGST